MQVEIKGIKCDSCDYTKDFKKISTKKEMIKQYKKWVDKPCPKCGANLLTKEDFEAMNVIFAFADLGNTVEKLVDPDKKMERFDIPVEMNGSGKINIAMDKAKKSNGK